jgi:bacteriorhodopsin
MELSTLTISVEAFEIVSYILALGYASMAAAMLFFILTKNDTLPKFQMSSVISVVVMVSALLLLYAQKMGWVNAYASNGEAYALKQGVDLFTNRYRYLNWLIDVPMLLIQILFVAGITGAARTSYMKRLTISGALMFLTGYIGQFYEPGRLNESVTWWAFRAWCRRLSSSTCSSSSPASSTTARAAWMARRERSSAPSCRSSMSRGGCIPSRTWRRF